VAIVGDLKRPSDNVLNYTLTRFQTTGATALNGYPIEGSHSISSVSYDFSVAREAIDFNYSKIHMYFGSGLWFYSDDTVFYQADSPVFTITSIYGNSAITTNFENGNYACYERPDADNFILAGSGDNDFFSRIAGIKSLDSSATSGTSILSFNLTVIGEKNA